MSQPLVGLIGIGLVGAELAERFLKSGLQVLGYDVDIQRRDALSQLGGQSAEQPNEIAETCQRVVLSLPDSKIVKEVVDSVFVGDVATRIVVDTTTGDPAEMAQMAVDLDGRGIGYLDATIAGSSQHVRRAQAVLMVGGNESAYRACDDLWRSFCKETFYVGASGNGARMKLAVNLVIGLNRAVLAEGLSFAERLGLDVHQTLRVFKASPAYSAMMDSKGDKMIHQDFQPQARLAQHLKDVELILANGRLKGATMPLSELHRDLLARLVRQGYGQLDNSAIAKAFETESDAPE